MHFKDGPLQKITDHNPAYQHLHFPLLFPQGKGGFIDNIPCRQLGEDNLSLVELTIQQTKQQRKVTIMDWASFTFQQRPGNYSNHIIQAGRLFHELLVDVYVQIEGDRLSYLRRNQHQIRSELYHGLQDALHETDHERPIFGNQVGITQQTILPSSFTGSPRDMQQRYQDAMAIVREYGKPDLFITMTCNPNWKEIIDALLPGKL